MTEVDINTVQGDDGSGNLTKTDPLHTTLHYSTVQYTTVDICSPWSGDLCTVAGGTRWLYCTLKNNQSDSETSPKLRKILEDSINIPSNSNSSSTQSRPLDHHHLQPQPQLTYLQSNSSIPISISNRTSCPTSSPITTGGQFLQHSKHFSIKSSCWVFK